MLADRIDISIAGEFTCPTKSLAIFIHNQDIDFKSNQTLKLLDDCKTIEDVHSLRNSYPNIVPPILNS